MAEFFETHDWRFLALAIIFFLGLSGPWRVQNRLKDGYALGKLEENAYRFSRWLGAFRVLSLIFSVLAVIAFWVDYPFNDIFWIWAVIWFFVTTSLISVARRMLGDIPNSD